MIEVGVAVIDITPPAGLAMAGYAARTDAATGAHDPLTARALVVGDTAFVTVDVIGIDAALSQRVRDTCALPAAAVTIAATHTHGGPDSMPGRLANGPDAAFLERIEEGLIAVINTAAAKRRPARLYGGVGADPGFAKNRRHEDGAVDRGIPIIRFDDAGGTPIAIFVSYACHPVVLGADNLNWTADYTHFFRDTLEAIYPGAIAVCATGCAGDVATGHSAASSMSTAARPDRTFTAAAKIGAGLAQSVYSARLIELGASTGSAEVFTRLDFASIETESREDLAARWRAQADALGDDGQIFRIWADWAKNVMGRDVKPLTCRCTALNWGGASIVALPGEIFAETALSIRTKISNSDPSFVLAYSDDNPGYIPPTSEFQHGGYEVEEAHRFYGLGATFARGSAERLVKAARDAAKTAQKTAAPDRT